MRRHFRLVRCKKGRRDKRGRDCLANANNVEFRTKRTDHFGDIADLILEREGACLLWHVTGIEPVGHSNQVAVPEEVDHEVIDCPAERLAELLPGPCLIDLPGRRHG